MRYVFIALSSCLLVSLQAFDKKEFPFLQPLSVEKYDSSSKNYFTDKDNDNVRDDKDRCPNTKNTVHVDIFGCEILDDDDKDGVANKDDKCPQTQANVTVNLSGCEPDNDADGVPDAKDKCPNTQKDFLIDNSGCPKTKSLNINFKAKEFKVSNDTLPNLEEFANFLLDNPEYQALIYAYTDSMEAPNNDKQLAQKRANAVMDIIISYGVKLTRLTAIGMGSQDPLVDNNLASNRKKNRRIEVELLQ